MQKYDRRMNIRLMEEVNRINIPDTELVRKLGANPLLLHHWRNENGIPNSYYLAKLYNLGVDIIYILVGERTR